LKNQFSILRLYFCASDIVNRSPGWRRVFPVPLGRHLLSAAREAGVEQAILHRVEGGYLQGQSPEWDHPERAAPTLPQVLELIGDEKKLQTFLHMNQELLKPVRVVRLRAEELPGRHDPAH
jgi:PII-like signaling protein